MNETVQRSGRIAYVAAGLLVAFYLAVLALVYWAVVRAPQLAQRSDNPRLVEADLRIRRGRIVDANGVVLAETIGSDDAPLRHYPIESIGPAVGYYSFRHGTAGVEQGFDEVLRGNDGDSWETFWRNSLHRSQIGRDVRITLDADWQRGAEALMGDVTGALLILSIPDGAVKVMVSHPAYDPNRLDEQFAELAADTRAPLLNRVTQGRYQPGLALQPFLVASALDKNLIVMDESVTGAHFPVLVRDQLTVCREQPPGETTWITVLQLACPAPMIQLSAHLSAGVIRQSLERFGFYSQPDFPMQTAAVAEQPIEDPRNAIFGQDTLTVTPLQMARAWAAMANGGELPEPYLVQEVQNAAGGWQNVVQPEPVMQAVEAPVAATILAALRRDDNMFLEHSTTALSGPEDATTAWYLGFTPARSPRYAVVVVLENAADSTRAREIGRAALQLAPPLQ